MIETEVVVVAEGVLGEVPMYFASIWENSYEPCIIADEHTWEAAGAAIDQAFRKKGVPTTSYVFPGTPRLYGSVENVASVRAYIADKQCIPIAVGSGTINDIVKRASYECNTPYMVVPTAPSVDGYTSYGAALSVEGFKQTLPCSAPYAVIADLRVLRDAPYEMLASGYGDLVGKVPAGADWLIADFLGIHPIDREIWDTIQTPLHENLSHMELLVNRNVQSVKTLFRVLMETGFAMQKMRDSRPASGYEHLISHVWEMQGEELVSHGFSVAMGTLLSTMVYEKFLSYGPIFLSETCQTLSPIPWEKQEQVIHDFFSDSVVLPIITISKKKFPTLQERTQRCAFIVEHWEQVSTVLTQQLIPSHTLISLYEKIGVPSTPASLGISKKMVKIGMMGAQMIRNRYTIADLLFDFGLLEYTIDAVIKEIPSHYFL